MFTSFPVELNQSRKRLNFKMKHQGRTLEHSKRGIGTLWYLKIWYGSTEERNTLATETITCEWEEGVWRESPLY